MASLFLRSYRLRLVLFSVLISGLVLLTFGSIAWWTLSRSRIESLDGELRHFGYRVAGRTTRKVDATRMEGSLIDVFGAERARNRFFSLLAREEESIIYTSENWPNELDASAYAPGTEPLQPQPQVEKAKARRFDLEPPHPRIILEPRYYFAENDGVRYRIGVFSNSEVVLVLGVNLNQYTADMQQLRQAFLIALPAALLVVGIGAILLSRRALRPVKALGLDMENISAEDLDHRLRMEGADHEFSTIIENYNRMLERLERSFHQATRFSADASHELKTPLAIMRGTLERALTICDNDPELQKVYSGILEQVDRQKAVLENLLLLSRADSGQLTFSRDSVDLSAALETWLEDAGFLAEGRNISIKSDIEPGIRIEGDEVLLQQVAHNLFSNAVRHNEEGGSIECSLFEKNGKAIWKIANTGPLLDEVARKKIFDRFYRGSNTEAAGTGLGLSLVKEIVTAHRGNITAGVEGERNVLCVEFSVA